MREKIVIWCANHLPRTVAYWATIRVSVEGNNEYPGDQSVNEILERWRLVEGEPEDTDE